MAPRKQKKVGRLQGIAEGLRVGADAEVRIRMQPERLGPDEVNSLRRENETLEENLEELRARELREIHARTIEEGRSLLINRVVNFSKEEFEKMTIEQMQKALKDNNHRLRTFIAFMDKIRLLVENYPQLQ